MINRLLMQNISNDVEDRQIRFTPGLNIVLAERATDSGRTGSRNGAGKSTLIEIIDFCLGGACNRDDALPADLLIGWTFTLEMDIRNQPFVITRGCDEPDKVRVLGRIDGYPMQLELPQELDTAVVYSIKQWQTFLGWALFGLDPAPARGDMLASVAPKYDSLIRHFVRKVFENPLAASPGEWRSKAELAVTYLLGLDHVFLEHATLLRRLKSQIENKRSAAEQQAKDYVSDIALLGAECVRMKNEIDRRRVQLERFSVNEQVVAFNESIGELTAKYHDAANRCTANTRKLRVAKNARTIEYLPFENVKAIYEDAGAVFAQGTIRHMDLVKEFHERLQTNYTTLINEQIAKLETLIEQDTRLMEELDGKRSALAAAQEAQTAFDEFIKLQEALTASERDLAVREDCIKRYQDAIEEEKEYVKRRDDKVKDAQAKHHELEPVWRGEEKFFHDFIERLYTINDASLGIRINEGSDFGISYAPIFSSDRSLGKRKLKTLGFDLTLYDHQRSAGGAIDFMVHDSVLFESSDSRQFAEALRFIDEFCKKTNSQYITVLNSDDAQTRDFTAAIPYADLKEKYVIHTLTDDGPKGTLLGVYF